MIFFLNTHKMCHQINSTKEACRNSHKESLNSWNHPGGRKPSCLCPLGAFIFPLCSFLSFNVKPAPLCKVVRRSDSGCSTHSYCSGRCGWGAAPAAVVLQQPPQNALGPRGSLATQFDCTASYTHLHDMSWRGYTSLKVSCRFPVPYCHP